MTARLDTPRLDPAHPDAVAERWLADFAGALRSGNADDYPDALATDAWWRDLLAFTGDLRSLHGESAIRPLLTGAADLEVRDEALDSSVPPALLPTGEGPPVVQLLFRLTIRFGHVRGVARLTPDDAGRWRATAVLTTLDSLAGAEPAVGERRPNGVPEPGERVTVHWGDRRLLASECTERDPEVLVIGAGHSGLGLAAYLGAMNVHALVVERNARVGDNWRNRYDSLVLHDPVWSNHLPMMPFPPTWPVFTPKDKMGDWLDIYARALELNVWTRTELVSASYDPATKRWEVLLDRGGERRVLRPQHVVLATGLSGTEPLVPDIPGTGEFAGELLHSGRYTTDPRRSGRDVVVIGTGNSGHDIAQDLYNTGAHVTLVQRGPTYVVGGTTVVDVMLKPAYGENTAPTEIADLVGASFARRDQGFVDGLRTAVAAMADIDRDLLDALSARGFRHHLGDGGTGAMDLFLTRNGGYYIDVGASRLVADGSIGLVAGKTVERFVPEGVVMSDGTVVPADSVVFATGFRGILDIARRVLGDAVADQCGPVWGLDDEGEIRSVWRRSGHDGFWFSGGNLTLARIYNKYLALQIKADLDGIDLPSVP